MKIPKSSSMILATLAVSSSTPSLAAPTGDASTGAVSSSHISSRRSSVSYPSMSFMFSIGRVSDLYNSAGRGQTRLGLSA